MAKKAKVWDGSTWQDLASATTDLTPYSTTAQMNTAIDASKGLTFINKTDFTTTSNFSVDNVFSSTYNNYKLIFNLSTQSATTPVLFRFRTSGVDNSTSNYLYSILGTANWTSATSISQVGSGTSFDTSYASTNENTVSEYSVFNPFANQKTYLAGTPMSSTEGRWKQLKFNDTTSFDGFSLLPISGTISGTIRVYGYKNS